MLTIHVSSRFKRSFKKIPAHVKKNFAAKIDIFQKHPFNPKLKTHKLRGNLDYYYAFCLQDGYRVLFEFEDDNNILLVNIGSHDDYVKWERT